jgi:hypothetical protein
VSGLSNINVIETKSTSQSTNLTNKVILSRDSNLFQVYFESSLVSNEKDPTKAVNGKIVYDKKKKNDDFDCPERLSRRDIKVGQMMEINLKTEEVYELYKALDTRYHLYNEKGLNFGNKKYCFFEVDNDEIVDYISKNKVLLEKIIKNNEIHLLKEVLDLFTNPNIDNELISELKAIDISELNNIENKINLAKFDKVLDIWNENKNNSNEEFWQSTFESNDWVISQIFITPMIYLDSKVYLGGKSIDNKGGNITDFVYNNSISKNVSVIEIKTPVTELVGGKYRKTYKMSDELNGAVNQVLNYRDSFIKNYYSLAGGSSDVFDINNPQSIIIIGNQGNLNKDQIRAFENFRNELKNIEIITYDELFLRLSKLKELYSK